MPFEKRCGCSHHNAWFHGHTVDPVELRSATNQELLFFKEKSKHKGRKKFICLACRNRIKTEENLRKLQQKASVIVASCFSTEDQLDLDVEMAEVTEETTFGDGGQPQPNELIASQSKVSLFV